MQIIGKGVYHLAEAAVYAGVPVATLRSWFQPRSDGRGDGPLFQSDFERVDGSYAVSFINLIEAYVARFFKNDGVRPPVIRRAYELLREDLGTPHPFAHADLASASGRILVRDKNRQLVDVISKQHIFEKMKLERIVYDHASKLANAWEIATGVRISPNVNFGKPVVENTGVSTLVVARQYVANAKDASLVAHLYRLTEKGVEDAYRFEQSLKRIAA